MMITYKWTDGFVERSTQDVAENQKSQSFTFLQSKKTFKKCYTLEEENI